MNQVEREIQCLNGRDHINRPRRLLGWGCEYPDNTGWWCAHKGLMNVNCGVYLFVPHRSAQALLDLYYKIRSESSEAKYPALHTNLDILLNRRYSLVIHMSDHRDPIGGVLA